MEGCIFCGIIAGAVPSEKVYEDELVVAVRDISPRAPVHVLVMPKRHIASSAELEGTDEALAGHMMLTAARIASQEDIAGSGYRLVVNTGTDGAQSVMHLHMHLLGGRNLGIGMVEEV